MTSSAMAGERRWNSARRGGMTVLGKVAVPKPLNLPSQRLENHGLDPNVEIVPKGTLSWGTQSSSSATNAWGSSNADNSTSHLSGRPSSGGSGTRPSTAGSDRVNETSGSAWGPTSRPSSSSEILSSDQSSVTSLRPHSAEPRPASSQLSRFAEPVSDNQGAWGASGTSERLGMVSSKKQDFSLSSGDFPTLGSEKDPSNNISESKDEMGVAFDRLKRDDSESAGDGLPPSMERWQAEQQQYFNPNIPPQHFDAWRGPPINAPPGVWYRGPQGGPPFRPPVGPGGFPIEPFPYYHPQMPPPPFANSHPVPPPRGGPRGHHPQSGNHYRPEMHDAFMRPGMPYRPGFYPPPMPFDGYYGPPRGYYNPNEPDIPHMNMGANRPVYDGRYSAPNALGPSDSHARGGPGSAGKKSEDVGFSRSGDSRIPGKYLSEQGEWDGREQPGNREPMPPALASHPARVEKTAVKPRKYEWGAEDDGDDDIYSGGGGNYVPEIARAKANDFRNKKLESVSTSPLASGPKELESPFPSTAKDVTLMRKIEGLNAKVRSDGRADCSSSGEEHKSGLDAAIGKIDTFPRESGIAAPLERNFISEASFSREVAGPRDDRTVHHTAAHMSRRPYHGMSNRSDHGGKGKFGNQPADGSQIRSLAADVPNAVSASKEEPNHSFIEFGRRQDLEVAEIHNPAKEGGFNAKLQDSIGTQAQRAKMREIAKQRAMQLQKEEEERIRDQKAKALAKLEELNRRTQSGDAPDPVAKKSVSIETSKEQQEEKDGECTESDIKGDSPGHVIQLKNEGSLINEENKNQIVGSSITSKVVFVETSKLETLQPKQQDVVSANTRDGKPSSKLDEGFTSYKQKQINTAVKNYKENSVSIDSREGRRSSTDTSVKDELDVASSEDGANNKISESSIAQRASSRSSKSKKKQDDSPLLSTALAADPTQTIPPETSQVIMMPKAHTLQLNFGTIQVAVHGESGLDVSDQTSSLPSEDTRGKVNSQLKPQNTRRTPRSQQVGNKLSSNDATVWAPVRSHNKVDISGEATAKGDLKAGSKSGTSAKSDNVVRSSSRSKRAEMERYVPKPVAKELAEQVGMQPISSSVGTPTHNDTSSAQPVGSATADTGSSVGPGQGLVKQHKPGKVHGAWRQRAEFPHEKNIQQRQRPSSDPCESSLEYVSKSQSNVESDQLQAVTKTTSERIDSGSKIASLSPKDAVVTGKGKSYSYGGHKKSGNGQNNDNTNISNSESDKSRVQSPCSDTNQSERAITPKENRATLEKASSHWQPKANAHSVSGQKGSRFTINEGGGGETSRGNRKDYSLQQRGKTFPQPNESNVDGSHSERVPESKAEGNNEPRRGRMLTLSKYSNHNQVDETESGVADSSDVQHAQQFPVGSRRSGNQVNRSARGRESHEDLPAQVNRHHDRPRNIHYEYQPVGSLDYKKSFEGQGEGVRNAGSRNRGRGHSRSRRGGGHFRPSQSEHLQLATE